MAVQNEAQIWAVLAASGMGKGVFIKGELRKQKPRRLVVWDFMDEYQEFATKIETTDHIRQHMLKVGSGPLRVRYVSKASGEKNVRKEFEVICELVHAWGDCTFIVEELANVTTPGWSPPAWRKMTTSGRHMGIKVIGTSQTPALVDKTFLANCTMIHAGPLRMATHRQAVSANTDIPEADLATLRQFEFIQRWFLPTDCKKRGFVKPPTPTPTPRGKS